MAADFDEQRFRWVHPDRETWNRYRVWAGTGAVLVAGLGGLVLAGAGFTVAPPGPEPDLVECPGHPACVEALPDWFVDLPDTAVVETAVYNRFLRGLTANEAVLHEAMAGRVLVGEAEGKGHWEVEADGAYVTTGELLQDVADDIGLQMDTEATWTAAMRDFRLPVESRLELPADFPMRVDVDHWLEDQAHRAVDGYAGAVERAYASATIPVEEASLLERSAWHQARRNWAGSLVAFGLLAASAVLGGLFLFATRAHRRRQDRHVRLTRHRLEEVSVEPASVVRHPRIVGVLDSIALSDAEERDVAGFIARLGRDGHVLSAIDVQLLAEGIRARRRATAEGVPLDATARRAMDALRRGSEGQSG